MTFLEMADIYLKELYWLSFYDEVEWDSFLKAWEAETGENHQTTAANLEERILQGEDFETICKKDKEAVIQYRLKIGMTNF